MSEKKLYSWGTKNRNLNKGLIIDATKAEENAYSSGIMVDRNPFEEMDRRKSKKNSDNIIDTSEISADNLINIRENIKKQMPKNLSVFGGKESLIRNAEYTFINGNNEVKAGTRTKPSKKYMKPILDNLRELDLLLDSAVNLKSADVIQSKFIDVCLACEKYLSNRNPWSDEGKARKQMIRDFYDQVRIESMRFSNRIEEMKSNPGAVYDGKWVDVLSKVRTINYTDGEDGVKVTLGGGGTSEVHILEKDGKRMYFKESEQLQPDSLGKVYLAEYTRLETQYKEYAADLSHTQEEREAYFDKLSTRQDALQAIFKALCKKLGDEDTVEDFIDEYREPGKMMDAIDKLLQESFDEDIVKARECIDRIKGKVKKLNKQKSTLKIKKINASSQNAENSHDLAKQTNALRNQIDDSDYMALGKIFVKISNSLRCTSIATYDALIDKDAELTRRNVASARMAKLLGLNDGTTNLIVGSTLADVYINGKLMQGVAMEEAPGKELKVLEREAVFLGRKIRYSGNAFRELINLQIFDVIMGQVDRNISNYLCRYSQQTGTNVTEIDHLTGIDNDMCGGLLTYNDILKKGGKGINRLRTLEVNGELQIPVFEREFAEQIKNITPEIIHHNFCDVLSKSEREALIDRIKGVKKLIARLEKYERENSRKPGFSSKFVNKNDMKAWQNCVDSFGKKVKELMKQDDIDARQLKMKLEAELAGKLNMMSLEEMQSAKEEIEDKVKEVSKDTKNKLKGATYFRAQFF